MFLIQVKFSCRRNKEIFFSEFIFLVLREYSDISLTGERVSELKGVVCYKSHLVSLHFSKIKRGSIEGFTV